MSRMCFLAVLSVFAAVISMSSRLDGQTVTGVANRGQYTDRVTFQVQAEAGFNITATLNDNPAAVGSPVLVEGADFYEIIATRTPSGGGPTTSNIVHFVVLSSNRGAPERGLIEWTPYPLIASTSAEFAGAHLEIVAPQDYPQGLEIPIVAWVRDEEGSARRVNAQVTAPGFPSVRLLRGAGSGFLPPASTAGPLNYAAQVHSLTDPKQINIESATTWATVSGSLPASTTWAAGSRIHVIGHLVVPAGGTLTVGEGTVVKLNPLMNITNNGSIFLRGTAAQPIVLTATNHVVPEQHAYPWGGFIIRGAGRLLQADWTFMVGGGGAPSWNFGSSDSHRPEQPVLFVYDNARAFLTNCFIINTAGQAGNGYNSDVTFDHCLIQRAITAGEFVGGTIILNHCAVIEFPEDNGVVTEAIANDDYDAIYFTTGTHIILNTLIGFCKDDAIDSGSGGAGTVVVSNCWVEAALHEGLAWSGGGRVTETYDSVCINNGQGLECGWSNGNNSPRVYANNLLSLANSVGFRFGDNYTSIGDNHQGFMTVSNSFALYNYRDVWSYTFSDWAYRDESMDVHDNFLTQPNSSHPNNTLWNPSLEGWRLEAFMTTPATAPVGIGIAMWDSQTSIDQLSKGVPVRLSSFTTQPVSVDFTLQDNSGATFQTGTLEFAPGETVKRIPVTVSDPASHELVRVSLSNPVRAELTGASRYYYVNPALGEPEETVLIPRNSTWKYHDLGQDLGTAWRDPSYNDDSWASGPGNFGFGDPGIVTVLQSGPSGARYPTFYFRAAFMVDDPNSIGSLQIGLRRDDGGVVYINGQEIYRNNMPQGSITFGTFASGSTPSETAYEMATLPATGLVSGINVIAVEIHQATATSSDMHFDLELVGSPEAFQHTPLVSRGATWRYHNLGEDLGSAWRQLDYNDASWSSGPANLGFGDPGIATVIGGGPSNDRFPTIYFRHSFTLDDLTDIGQLVIGLRRDDGGVIYVNGVEVWRSNMPEGPITYNTFAPSATSSETAFFQGTGSASSLQLGQNVVAVEIHQDDDGSSDLHFDLELFGAPAPPPPELKFTKFGNDLLLYWFDPMFLLQSAQSVDGPWSGHSPTSPVEASTSEPQRFFRLSSE